jgi:hypothetical protein
MRHFWFSLAERLHALGDLAADEPHHVAGLQQFGPKLDAEDSLVREIVPEELRIHQVGNDGNVAGLGGDPPSVPGDLDVVVDVPTVGGADKNLLHISYPFESFGCIPWC